MNKFDKKPLYRKVNTKARGVHHDFGESYKRVKSPSKMTHKDRGLDYTPLYKFLLSKVGSNWYDVYSEAISRLDSKHYKTDENPIFYIVSQQIKNDDIGYVRIGESSYYSSLFIDKNNVLQKVNNALNETGLKPFCSCCTHTLNGKQFTQKYQS
jgi:hypothetical protein